MARGQKIIYNRIRVYGRVQRVLFRDSARRKAKSLGLVGYAKNLKDGSLEILAQGEKEAVSKLFEWAKRGPIFARVDKYEIDTCPLELKLDDFKIEY